MLVLGTGFNMTPINKDELFNHLSDFLKNRGVELKDGAITQQVQKGCSILADSVNISQEGFERARVEIDKKLDQMRQVIHERTAPKTPGSPPPAGKQPPKAEGAAPKSAGRKRASTGKKKARKTRS
jgi:hypothetical protein